VDFHHAVGATVRFSVKGKTMTTVNLDSSALTSALEQLRLKLLDLTGRNRLIHFKHTAGKSLQFIEGHPAAIYQRLVEANNKVMRSKTLSRDA